MEAQLRFCTEVPVACIPANYRKRLPRQARLCYVEELVWNETDKCYFTRIGPTPQAVTCARPLRLGVEEAEAIFHALEHPTDEEPPIYAAPSYILPEAIRELDSSRSYDLGDELAQITRSHAPTSLPAEADVDGSVGEATERPEDGSFPCRLYDHWFVAPTSITDNEGRCLVWAAPLSHRLSGRSSGTVYTAWLDTTILEQAMPVDGRFARLDCHESRLQVNGFAIAHGAVPPMEPEPVRRAEAALTTTALEEQYQLVPLKDPIYLRKEDIIASVEANAAALPTMLDTQRMLSKAIAAVQRDQTLFAQQHRDGEVERLDVLLRCLEETLNWYGHLPRRHQRGECILSVSVLGTTSEGQKQRQPRCIQLVVGVPVTLPLPWSQMADAFCWPQGTGTGARSGPPAAGARARIVA